MPKPPINITEGKLCHERDFKKPCIGDKCVKFIVLQGVDPQDGSTRNEFGCSDAWLPLLLVEVSQKLVKLDATLESHRNEVSKDSKVLAAVNAEAVKQTQGLLSGIQTLVDEAAREARIEQEVRKRLEARTGDVIKADFTEGPDQS